MAPISSEKRERERQIIILVMPFATRFLLDSPSALAAQGGSSARKERRGIRYRALHSIYYYLFIIQNICRFCSAECARCAPCAPVRRETERERERERARAELMNADAANRIKAASVCKLVLECVYGG